MSTADRKTYKLGNLVFVLPLRTNGFYVSDAKGSTVAECQNSAVALALVTMIHNAANNS